jgi:hypothetical protein
VPDSEDSAQLCAFLSEAAAKGVESSRSMRLIGQIPGHEMVILLDSGSSHTFLSSALASKL